jgi:hypothetical protein
MNIPAIMPYPPLFDINKAKQILGKLCYFVEPYALDGVTTVAYLSNGAYRMKIGKFDGSIIDPSRIKKASLESDILAVIMPKILGIIKHARIIQAQFYFSKTTLVDVRISLNKFVGPGMLRDLFEKAIGTQKVIKISLASESEMKGVSAVLKPSAFKTMVVGDDIFPLYCKI